MAKKEKVVIGDQGIHDASVLGKPRMLVLGVQHTFAMFGATVLVPLLTGLDVATTLLMAGLGTLFFHLVTKGKVPAFLGSSFAFLGGYAAVAPYLDKNGNVWVEGAGAKFANTEMLPYAGLGVAVAGLIYLVFALLIKLVGVKKVMKFFPPVVTGPIIIAIGLSLAGSAVNNCKECWPLALISLAIVVIFNIWGKGMAKIIPILLGVVGSYIVAIIVGNGFGYEPMAVDFSKVQAILNNIAEGNIYGPQGLFFLPIVKESTVLAVDFGETSKVVSSIIAIAPIALATMMEHIGDISAISATCGKNFIADPGLHKTLIGDGVATSLAALVGGPANTTYGENTGVLALSKVYDPKVIRIAAVFAVGISFFPIVSALISSIPTAIIGGISFILYGMISGIGVRNVVENKVDFSKSRNLIVAAIILVCALGLGSVSFTIGKVGITLTALAVAAIAGILLNAILPGNDYVFEAESYDNAKKSKGDK
ncbi:MAG: uracil-xanthine permease [Clostridia bacterium]|nr:uracil-xanthine permease [Clostridia bacterium]